MCFIRVKIKNTPEEKRLTLLHVGPRLGPRV
jgi:hypothetical protein